MNRTHTLFVGAVALATAAAAADTPRLKLEKGDRIVLVGGSLGERQQHTGRLEARLHARFPGHELVIRNLAVSADEVTPALRLRSAGFGTPEEHLKIHKADVVLAFFGFNESFAGAAGVEKYKTDLTKYVKDTQAGNYGGKGATRVVLFSPIAQENLKDPNLTDGSANNKNIKLYTDATGEVAVATGATFVDLFALSQAAYSRAEKPLTFNGIHLTDHGEAVLAPEIDKALFGEPAPAVDDAKLEKIRKAIVDKNFQWFHRHRTVDGFNVYGGRSHVKYTGVDKKTVTNRVVMDREMEVLDVMTANRDKVIWAAARGEDLKVDDSNTPPFIPVATNKPGAGPNGTHIMLGGEEAIKKMTVGKGLKVSLFASEEQFPLLAKPVQMAFSPEGKLYVIVVPSYPHWLPKDEMNDKVICLEDTDGDGKADKCTTVISGLNMPTGLEFWNGGLYVAEAPYLRFFKDTDGDGKFDWSERVIGGLDSADTHHASNSMVVCPGGALYFQEGTFHHSAIESVNGPQRCANGGVFRFDPRTHRFDVHVSYGFANPHGHVFDRWGQEFVTDGTGNANYFATAFSGRIDFPSKHGKLNTFFKQRTRPCPGTEFLVSSHFPDEFQGNYLDPNVIGFQGILRYKMEDAGSGFGAKELEPMISSSDVNFRPSDLEVGPDGALWFLDWHNPIIGHLQHHLRDPSRDHTHGRIYRITAEGRPLLTPAKIAGEPIAKLLDLLKSSQDRVRYRARAELSGRKSDEVIAAAKTWMEGLDKKDADYEHHMLEGLWLHQQHNKVDEALLKRTLKSPEPRARAAATRVLCYWLDNVSDPAGLLKQQVNDDHPRVRLEAIRACSYFNDPKSQEIALESLVHPQDYHLEYTLKETLNQLDKRFKKK